MCRYTPYVYKSPAAIFLVLAFNLNGCGDPRDDRKFSLVGLTLGMQVSELEQQLRAKGLKPMGRDIWIGPFEGGRQRVIYRSEQETIWKLFYANEGIEVSQAEGKNRVVSELGKPDEEKEIKKGRLGNGLAMTYKGDQSDKTATLTVSVWDKVITWDLVSEDIKQAAIAEAKEERARAQARCQELLDKPVNELSVNERMEAMGCATKPLFEQMGKLR